MLNVLQEKVLRAKSIDSLEILLESFKKILHPNHFILVSIKNSLVDSFGILKNYRLPELSETMICSKINFCNDIKAVLDVFERGKSRAKAFLMFDQHCFLVLYAKFNYEKGTIRKTEYMDKLRHACIQLKECIEIFSWEDENAFTPLKHSKRAMMVLEKTLEQEIDMQGIEILTK